MAQKLLLVDDENPLLDHLEELLKDCRDVFETHSCNSVDQAITASKKHVFDLIITDIKMPGKSGIDLLMHLKKIDYQGKFMVMTAYGNEEIYAKVHELGGIRIIAKPFDFDWLKDLLLNYFQQKKGFSGTIESIDLTSLLQLINLERKSVAVKIEVDNGHGFLYFNEGEIVNADFSGLKGEEAAIKLINQNSGKFSVLKPKKVKQVIDMPFLTFMMETMKIIDEERCKDDGASDEVKIFEEQNLHFKVSSEIFTPLTAVFGIENAAIFNSHGDLIIEKEKSKRNMKDWGIYGLNLFIESVDIITRMGDEQVKYYQIQTDKSVFFFTALVPQKVFLMVILNVEGNLGILRNKLKTISDSAYKHIYFNSYDET